MLACSPFPTSAPSLYEFNPLVPFFFLFPFQHCTCCVVFFQMLQRKDSSNAYFACKSVCFIKSLNIFIFNNNSLLLMLSCLCLALGKHWILGLQLSVRSSFFQKNYHACLSWNQSYQSASSPWRIWPPVFCCNTNYQHQKDCLRNPSVCIFHVNSACVDSTDLQCCQHFKSSSKGHLVLFFPESIMWNVANASRATVALKPFVSHRAVYNQVCQR